MKRKVPCRYCGSPRGLDQLAGHERVCRLRRSYCQACSMQHGGALRFKRHDAYPGHVAMVAPAESRDGQAASAVFAAMRELASARAERRAS